MILSMHSIFNNPALIFIILFISIITCIIACIQNRKVDDKPKHPCGIIYVNEKAKRDEPAFRCEVNDDFFEAAFSEHQAYVIFEIRKENSE